MEVNRIKVCEKMLLTPEGSWCILLDNAYHPWRFGAGREAVFGRLLLFVTAAPKTYVYIDGFNLYYGALRGTPFRWLDLGKLCELLLPGNDVQAIKYFTALVKSTPSALQQPVRQQTYLRALRTIPRCSVTLGIQRDPTGPGLSFKLLKS